PPKGCDCALVIHTPICLQELSHLCLVDRLLTGKHSTKDTCLQGDYVGHLCGWLCGFFMDTAFRIRHTGEQAPQTRSESSQNSKEKREQHELLVSAPLRRVSTKRLHAQPLPAAGRGRPGGARSLWQSGACPGGEARPKSHRRGPIVSQNL